jgi:hypothetical protein
MTDFGASCEDFEVENRARTERRRKAQELKAAKADEALNSENVEQDAKHEHQIDKPTND